MKENLRKNSTSLGVTIGVVLAHIVVIALIVSSCSRSSGKNGGEDGKTGTNPAPTEIVKEKDKTPDEPAPRVTDGKKNDPNSDSTRWCDQDRARKTAPRRLRVPVGKPDFGRPLTADDVKNADHSPCTKFLKQLKTWPGTGIVVDVDNCKVLWEKDSRKPVPAASMVKMMTILLVAEEIDRNPKKLSLDTEVTVTASAMNAIHPKERTKNQLKVLKPGDVYTVRQLLLCTAVISSNEAATQLAEVVGGGSVDAFVGRMNERAKELGLTSVKFHTPSGLNHWRGKEKLTSKASAADLVVIAERLLEYPEVFKMFSASSAMINGKALPASNHLVRPNRKGQKRCAGVDGIKTGFIADAGFCLTFSVLRNNRRVIGCVTKFSSSRDRDNFCQGLIKWAYSQLK